VWLPIAILDRPLRRNTVAMPERFKILFAQPKKRRAVNLRVAADVIAETWINRATILVQHPLGRVILERAFIVPIILLPRQERPAFQDQDPLPTRSKAIQQRPATGSGSDDDYVVVLGHAEVGRGGRDTL